MPTPVGPLGPDEIDPNDPDLWDWEAGDHRPPRPARWVRATAWIIAAVFVLALIATLRR
jgi:hypothetical protein